MLTEHRRSAFQAIGTFLFFFSSSSLCCYSTCKSIDNDSDGQFSLTGKYMDPTPLEWLLWIDATLRLLSRPLKITEIPNFECLPDVQINILDIRQLYIDYVHDKIIGSCRISPLPLRLSRHKIYPTNYQRYWRRGWFQDVGRFGSALGYALKGSQTRAKHLILPNEYKAQATKRQQRTANTENIEIVLWRQCVLFMN